MHQQLFSVVHKEEVRLAHVNRTGSFLTVTSLGIFPNVWEATEAAKHHPIIRQDAEAVVCPASMAHAIQSVVAANRRLRIL